MKFAIIGMGFIYPRHLKSIKEIGGDITWVCDIENREIPEGSKFTNNYKDIKDVDCVIICTPNYLHFEMAQYFLDRGIKVLCEKPPVISSEIFEKPFKDFNVVLQLHYHPEIIKFKKQLRGRHSGKIEIKVFRNKSYWDGWKGKEYMSGGMLFNIGVHYIDLLMYLFGDKYEIIQTEYSDKIAKGKIDFMGNVFDYYFEIMDTNEGQTRTLEIDGKEIELSKQDNLSYEDLHTEVYNDFIKGRGVMFSDCYNLIKLIEELQCNSINVFNV